MTKKELKKLLDEHLDDEDNINYMEIPSEDADDLECTHVGPLRYEVIGIKKEVLSSITGPY